MPRRPTDKPNHHKRAPQQGNGETEKASSAGREDVKKGGVSVQIVLAVLMGVTALALALYTPASQWWNSWLHARAVAELN